MRVRKISGTVLPLFLCGLCGSFGTSAAQPLEIPTVGTATTVVSKGTPPPSANPEPEDRETPPRGRVVLDPDEYPAIPLPPDKEEEPGRKAVRSSPVSFDLRTRQAIVHPGIPLRSGVSEGHTLGSPGEVVSPWDLLDRPEKSSKNFSSLSRVGNPEDYPWRTAVKLFIEIRSTSGDLYKGSCSGTLIDPQHVLTAGHCVYFHEVNGVDFYDWAEKITVVPAYEDGSQPYGDAVSAQLHSWTGWTDDEDHDHDYGLIDLDRPVGALTGWLGYGWYGSCSSFTGNTFRQIGYPGESPYDGRLMYSKSGKYDSCETLLGVWYGNEVRFDSRSYKGESGSGSHSPSGSCPSCWVYAIHSNGSSTYTDHVRLDQEKFDFTGGAVAADVSSSLDLIPLNIRASPASIRAGSQLSSMDYLVHNYSNAAWSGTVNVTVYLSTNDNTSSSDRAIQSHSFSGSFPPKGSVRVTLTPPPTIPAGVTADDYWIGIILNVSDARSGNNDSDGQDMAPILVTTAPTAPTVTTSAATGLGQTGATLNGSVNPNGSSTTAYFDYGLTTSYGATVTYGGIGSGTSTLSVSRSVSGLTCGTTYHFRVRAVSSAGTTPGNDRTFQTSACSGGPLDAVTTGVFRPSTGSLYLKNRNTSGFADVFLSYGIAGDYPVAGDWNGDGVDTIGVYRNGTFYLRNSNTNGIANVVVAFGAAGDQPVVGDWNGDGIDTIGVFRNGTFYLRNSNTAGPASLTFSLGKIGDVGISGDWNGDGVTTAGVFRPSNGALYLKNSNSTGFAEIVLTYGLPGDKPVTGDWNGDGVDTIGIYRGGTFYLRNSNTNGFADLVFSLGVNGDMPIAGDWNGLP